MTWDGDEPLTSELVHCPACGHAARVVVRVFDTRRFRCTKCRGLGRTVARGDATGWVSSAQAPLVPRPTASEFANWVFEWSVPSLKVSPDRSEHQRHRMVLGAITHREIDQFMRFRWTQDFLAGHATSDWRLLFADNGETERQTFRASRLTVEQVPVRCVPDAVLMNSSTNTILIIERKTTNVPKPSIPENGWPNVEAQLWCYSHIDDWRGVREVLLVGQLWHRFRGGVQLCHTHPSWKRDDPAHENRCRIWFERYGGQLATLPATDQDGSTP